jgi:hypothetical protein
MGLQYLTWAARATPVPQLTSTTTTTPSILKFAEQSKLMQEPSRILEGLCKNRLPTNPEVSHREALSAKCDEVSGKFGKPQRLHPRHRRIACERCEPSMFEARGEENGVHTRGYVSATAPRYKCQL